MPESWAERLKRRAAEIAGTLPAPEVQAPAPVELPPEPDDPEAAAKRRAIDELIASGWSPWENEPAVLVELGGRWVAWPAKEWAAAEAATIAFNREAEELWRQQIERRCHLPKGSLVRGATGEAMFTFVEPATKGEKRK